MLDYMHVQYFHRSLLPTTKQIADDPKGLRVTRSMGECWRCGRSLSCTLTLLEPIDRGACPTQSPKNPGPSKTAGGEIPSLQSVDEPATIIR